jgi:heptaprenyl diphosphate synthase
LMSLSEALRLPDLDADLQRVDDALHSAVQSEDPFLSEVASHLITAGGKRLRPALAVAAAAVGGVPVSDDVIQGGVAVELVHLGSLYHDDVMDNADTRHGVPSVNARWGNLVAIVAGDFLLARASEIAAGLGTEVAALLAATIGRLCEGQVAEVQTAFDPGRGEPAYFAAIAGKTASLYAAACRIGAITAGLDGRLVDAVTSFGHSFGMAFQIRDDVLDVVGTDEVLGKPAGHDMVEGVYTLPVIRALAAPDAGAELRALLRSPLDEPARNKATAIVRAAGGVGASIEMARRFADSAAEALAPVSGSVAAGLAGLAHRLLDDLDA